LAAVAVIFGMSRLAILATGGRFSTQYLGAQPQLAPLNELRAHPFHVAFSLHTQPPLYNLLVGSILRWSPLAIGLSFQVVWLLAAFVLAVAMYGLLLELGAGPVVAVLGTTLVMLDPYLLGPEMGVNYDGLVPALLVLTCYFAARHVRSGRCRWFGCCVVAATTTVLTRSLFHPMWMVALIVGLVAFRRPTGGWRRPVVVSAVSLSMVLAIMVSNQVRFGSFQLSSFLGMNLQRAVIAPMPESEVQRLVDEGRISPLSQIPPFSPYRAYEPMVGPCRPHHRDPVLADLSTQAGFPNFNSECFLPLYAQAQRDALHALRAEPGTFLLRRPTATVIFFSVTRPSSGDPVTRLLLRLYDPLLLEVTRFVSMVAWQSPVGFGPLILKVSLLLGAAAVVVLASGALAVIRLLRNCAGSIDRVMVMLAFSVLWVAVVGVTTEMGENGRFRLYVDPILLGVLTVKVAAGAKWCFRTVREWRELSDAS